MKITVQDYRRTQTKHGKAKKGHGGLRWIALGNFEKRRPTFFQIYVSLYQNIIYTAGKSFSVVM